MWTILVVFLIMELSLVKVLFSKSNVALPTLNGKLPDFSARENGYNPLIISETPLKKIEAVKKIIISVLIFIFISLVAIFAVIKFL